MALQIALLSVALEPTRAAEYGTADEAKAMLERAVAPVKEDKGPRPGTEKPLEKITFYTRVGDQDCGVGYYKG